MGKVVTSQGLKEFVQEGKFEEVKADKPPKTNEAPPLEVKKEQAPQDVKEPEKTEEKVEYDYHDEDDQSKAEIEKSEKFRKVLARKQFKLRQAEAELKKAKDEIAESERFSENQYNRARLAEEQRAQLERELKELRAKAPAKEPELKEPDENDPAFVENGQFNWRKFTKAQSEYVAATKLAEFKKSQDEALSQRAKAEAEAKAKELVEKTKSKYPDFDDTVGKMVAEDIQTYQSVIDYVSASENIGELLYYIAKHPDFIPRINKLHHLRAIAAIRDIERAFEATPKAESKEEAPAPAKVSGAPAPITPLPTSASVNVNTDPSKMDFRQLRAFERERAKKRS